MSYLTLVFKKEQDLNMDYNSDDQMAVRVNVGIQTIAYKF